jgi:hypothetical protein
MKILNLKSTSSDVLEGKEFVDYATRCALNRDPLSPADMHTVKVGTKAMGDTRELLPLRGNVREDATKTRDASAVNAIVARNTANEEYKEDLAETKTLSHKFAKLFSPREAKILDNAVNQKVSDANLAHCLVLGTGACGEFSTLTARNVVGNLSAGETANQWELTSRKSNGERVNHAIAKIVPPQGSGNSEVLLDAWAKGSGVRTRDAPSTIAGRGRDIGTFSPDQGPKLLADLDANFRAVSTKSKESMIETTIATMESLAAKVADRDKKTTPNPEAPYKSFFSDDKKRMYDEIHTTSREFEERSREAAVLVKKVQGPRNEHEAVVVGETNRRTANAINETVPRLATEMGISNTAAAERVAAAVESISLQSPRAEEKEWVRIRQR